MGHLVQHGQSHPGLAAVLAGGLETDESERNTETGLNVPAREPNWGSLERWVAASIQPLRGLVCGLRLLGAWGSQLLRNWGISGGATATRWGLGARKRSR